MNENASENPEVRSDPSLPSRRSVRLPEFDYGMPGSYFVTIVNQDRRAIFGQIIDGVRKLGEFVAMRGYRATHDYITDNPDRWEKDKEFSAYSP